MSVSDVELAWLSGFWDGEGSVGIATSGSTRMLRVQLSHTEFSTVEAVLRIMADADIHRRGYTYQERNPTRHRDAHYIRVNGIANVRKFALLMLPFSVTKRRHWEIAIEWADSRIKAAGGVDKNGKLSKRGGSAASRAYTESELALFNEMRTLNRRGPDDRAVRRQEGRITNDFGAAL